MCLFSEEQQPLMPYVICLSIALFGIVLAILFILYKQRHLLSDNQHAHLPNFNGNKIYSEDSTTANNQKKENWKRYLNKVHSLSDNTSGSMNGINHEGKPQCSQMSDNIYKATSAELEKNIAYTMPFQKNFEKNDLKGSQMKESNPEPELIV